MKYKISVFFFLILVFGSCQNQDQKRLAENARAIEKNQAIFDSINKNWDFYDTPINEVSEENFANWNEWRQFLQEMGQKPRNTIGAFQKKATAISSKADNLKNNIPIQFDQPQIRSRISTIITKVKMLDLFIHLNEIPAKKVTFLVAEINKELVSLQRQMDKIVQVSKIPEEEGESELMKMLLDTTHAIPNAIMDKKIH